MTVTVDGEPVPLDPGDVEVTRTPRSGWQVAADGPVTVALDLTLTPPLRRAGVARDVVRLVQQARKDQGLAVSDRITLHWAATGTTAEAIEEHAATIAEEVLAVTVERLPTADEGAGLQLHIRAVPG